MWCHVTYVLCVFHRRFRTLVPFTDMKIFTTGISHLSGLNAFEYRDIMKCAVVCFKGRNHASVSASLSTYDIMWCHMTGLFDDLDPVVDKAVTRVFLCYTKWYMMLRLEEHDDTTLANLHQTGRLLILSLKTFLLVSGPLSEVSMTSHDIIWYHMNHFLTSCDIISYDVQCSKIKFHMILHYAESIRRFGCVRNFVAESFEMAHKPSKAAARRTNWQVIWHQMTFMWHSDIQICLPGW